MLSEPQVDPSCVVPATQAGLPNEPAQLVMLIHAAQGSPPIWTRLRPVLHSCGLRVLSVDRPEPDHTTGAARSHFRKAAALTRLLDAQRDSPTVVVGHGSGAGTALALAVIAPHHVRSLVLVAPAADAAAVNATNHALAAPLVRVAHRLCHNAMSRRFSVAQRQLTDDARQLERHLPAIRCPVVIVAGSRDRVVRPRAIAALSRKLPDCDVISTEVGHWIPIDDPGAVATAVLRALGAQYRQSLTGRRSSLGW